MTPFAQRIGSRVLALVACLFALLTPTLGRAADPAVVLVQPVPGSTDGPAKLTAEDRLGRCIGLHLQEHLTPGRRRCWANCATRPGGNRRTCGRRCVSRWTSMWR